MAAENPDPGEAQLRRARRAIFALVAAGALLGAPGLIAAAAWAGVHLWWHLLLVPLVLDGGLAFAAWSAHTAKKYSRPVWHARTLLFALTGVSVAAQLVHGLASSDGLPAGQRAVGIAIGVAGPITVLLATETLLALAFPRVRLPRARRAAPATPLRPGATGEAQRRKTPATASQLPAATGRTARSAAPVDPEDVRRLAAAGASQRAIANQLGTSKSTVARTLAKTEAA